MQIPLSNIKAGGCFHLNVDVSAAFFLFLVNDSETHAGTAPSTGNKTLELALWLLPFP